MSSPGAETATATARALKRTASQSDSSDEGVGDVSDHEQQQQQQRKRPCVHSSNTRLVTPGLNLLATCTDADAELVPAIPAFTVFVHDIIAGIIASNEIPSPRKEGILARTISRAAAEKRRDPVRFTRLVRRLHLALIHEGQWVNFTSATVTRHLLRLLNFNPWDIGSRGETGIYPCIYHGWNDMLCLYAQPKTINTVASDGYPAVAYAASHNRPEIVDLLVKWGADLAYTRNRGIAESVFEMVAVSPVDNPELVKAMFGYYEATWIPRRYHTRLNGIPRMHLNAACKAATDCGNIEIASMLILFGAELDE